MSDLSTAPAQPKPRERLSHLKLAGFRSIRSLDLPLRDLNVLIGANGSGKSNLVGFFNMLSFLLSEHLQLYIQRKGAASSVLHYGPQVTPVLSAKLSFLGSDGTSAYEFSLAFAAPDRLIFTDERVAFQNTGKPKPFARSLGSAHTETQLKATASSETDSAPRTVARVFLRRLQELQVYHFHDTSEAASIRTNQDLDRNQYLLSTGGNLAAFLYMLEQSYPAHYERIVATIRLAVPYFRGFVLKPDRLNPKRIALRWHNGNPDYEFGPHQLSDGSLRAIALIAALMQPEELLPGLIIIDEPELGLHPSAISTIAQLIQAVSAKRQVLVATQSPRLIAAFAPEDVVVVERREDERGYGESTFQRLNPESLGEWMDRYDLGQLYEMNVTGGGPQ